MSDDVFACRKNSVVIASAGTGKTFTLVGMIAHLLLGLSENEQGDLRSPADPRTIVATTFSRRAAGEIRERLAHVMHGLATDPEGSLLYPMLEPKLGRAFGASPLRGLRGRAEHARARLREVEITTLHGLSHRIVVAHGRRIGLAEVDVQPPGEHALFVESVVQEVLEDRSPKAPRDLARALDATGSLEALVHETTRAVMHVLEMGIEASALPIPDDLARIERTWATMLALVAPLTTPRFESARRALDRDRTKGQEPSLASLRELFAVAARGKVAPEERAFFDFRGELPGSTSRDKAERFFHLHACRRELGPFTSYVRGLVDDAAREYERRARSLSRLGFSDLVRLSRDMLRDDRALATQVGRDMSWLFVDEAQDTSPIQRDLILLLWAQAGSRPRASNDETPRLPTFADVRPQGLVVVGDRKQSIYQFRGADVAVFAELAVGLAGARAREALAIPPGLTWEPETPTADLFALRDNRRGTPTLLAFANELSRELFVPEMEPPALYEIRYQPASEDLRPARTGGAGAAVVWHRLGEGPSSRLVSARAVVDVVLGEMERGEPLQKTQARPTPGDIAILAPTNEMLSACEFALAERDIPYTVAGRNFFESDEVVDALAMLELFIDPEDPTALATVLRGPWMALSDDMMLALVDPVRGLVPPRQWMTWPGRAQIAARDVAHLEGLAAYVARMHERVRVDSTAELLAAASDELDFENVLRELPRGRERIANLEKLLAMACEHPDARTFCRYVRTHAERGTRENEADAGAGDSDAVRLLTVHASKGLDFPVVVIPEVDGRLPARARAFVTFTHGSPDAAQATDACISVRAATRDGFRVEPPSHQDAFREGARRERAERQRLWYVAATRATDRMHFVGRSTPKARPGTTAAAALDALAARGLAQLEVTDVGVPNAKSTDA